VTITINDEIGRLFANLRSINREVAYQQLSSAGSSVKDAMRAALRATSPAKSITRVSADGKAYLDRLEAGREYGLRESMVSDGKDSNPKSMSNFINSFLAEKSGTLIVGGAHPDFYPIIRRDGKVTGTLGRVKGVGTRTIAILQRMDDGSIGKDYDNNSRLSNKITESHYSDRGISASLGKVKEYLDKGWADVMGRAINNTKVETTTRVVHG